MFFFDLLYLSESLYYITMCERIGGNTVDVGCSFAQQITRLCHEHYKTRLSKNGKPQKHCEWTLLAAVVQSVHSEEDNRLCNMKVVAMGSGSKCIGRSHMCSRGGVINDSHAEVIARRSFLRYLYGELRSLYVFGKSSVFQSGSDNKCSLCPGVNFHLFTSHVPCGDASIFPQTYNLGRHASSRDSDVGEIVSKPDDTSSSSVLEDRKRPPAAMPACPTKCKALKTNESGQSDENLAEQDLSAEKCTNGWRVDVHRTGAKCVPGQQKQDTLAPGLDYHVTGVLRTKPGRGERTLSMSCSDKIMKWNVVGAQGALLAHFLSSPIYFLSIIVGGSEYSHAAMKRAVVDRVADVEGLVPPYRVADVELSHVTDEFEHCRSAVEAACIGKWKTRPSAAAIIWYEQHGKYFHEVSVNGRRLGITTKDLNSPKAKCSISKAKLFQTFMSLLSEVPDSHRPDTLRFAASGHLKTYEDFKQASTAYQSAWHSLQKMLQDWIVTPRHYNAFTVDCHQ